MKTLATFDLISALAAFYGCKKKAIRKAKELPFLEIQGKCGRRSAVLWVYLQDRDVNKKYGYAGQIILQPDRIAKGIDWDLSTVESALLRLIMNGFVHVTSDGNAVKAA